MTSTDTNEECPANTHPFWCALTDQCITRPDNPEHHGRGSRWQTHGDDVEIVVHEVRLDEEFPPDSGRMLRGQEGVYLSLRNTAIRDRFADVHLDKGDVDVLLNILMRAQGRLQHCGVEVTAADLLEDEISAS